MPGWCSGDEEPSIWDVRADSAGRLYVETDDPNEPEYVSESRWPSYPRKIKKGQRKAKSRRK
jgi:hypothetical protein